MKNESLVECSIRALALLISSKTGINPIEESPGFSNDVFEIRPYCWCDGDEPNHVEDGCPLNFYHKESGLSVSWYKHLGRDMHVDDEITSAKWADILEDCLKSIK